MRYISKMELEAFVDLIFSSTKLSFREDSIWTKMFAPQANF